MVRNRLTYLLHMLVQNAKPCFGNFFAAHRQRFPRLHEVAVFAPRQGRWHFKHPFHDHLEDADRVVVVKYVLV